MSFILIDLSKISNLVGWNKIMLEKFKIDKKLYSISLEWVKIKIIGLT
jgi:hypothetical protein